MSLIDEIRRKGVVGAVRSRVEYLVAQGPILRKIRVRVREIIGR